MRLPPELWRCWCPLGEFGQTRPTAYPPTSPRRFEVRGVTADARDNLTELINKKKNKNGTRAFTISILLHSDQTGPPRSLLSARLGSQRIGMVTTSSKRACRSRGLLIAGKRAQLTRGLAIERALELGIY